MIQKRSVQNWEHHNIQNLTKEWGKHVNWLCSQDPLDTSRTRVRAFITLYIHFYVNLSEMFTIVSQLVCTVYQQRLSESLFKIVWRIWNKVEKWSSLLHCRYILLHFKKSESKIIKSVTYSSSLKRIFQPQIKIPPKTIFQVHSNII